jgi:hypothetical protein
MLKKQAAIILSICWLFAVSLHTAVAAAEQTPRPPRHLIPHCLIEAVVSKKLKDEPTSRTYKVTSAYWGSDAIAFRISRDDFTYVGYESAIEKTTKHWIRGWDRDVMNGDNLTDCDGLCREALVLAHLGVLYYAIKDFRSTLEDDGTSHTVFDGYIEKTFYPWSHIVTTDGSELYVRRKHTVATEQFSQKLSSWIPRSFDSWTTITLTRGHVTTVDCVTPYATYEDYERFGIVPLRAYNRYWLRGNHGVIFYDTSVCSIATSVRPLGPDDTPDKILPTLTRGLKQVRVPYKPPQPWTTFWTSLRIAFARRIRHIIVGLAIASLAWVAIRKLRVL